MLRVTAVDTFRQGNGTGSIQQLGDLVLLTLETTTICLEQEPVVELDAEGFKHTGAMRLINTHKDWSGMHVYTFESEIQGKPSNIHLFSHLRVEAVL